MKKVPDTEALLPADLYKEILARELGQNIRSCALVKLTRQYDGQLHSFVIRVRTSSGVLFLRRNVDHSMAQVYQNHKIMAANLPSGAVPPAVAFIPSIGAVLTREIPSTEFMPQSVRTKELLLASAGRLLRKVHSLPPKTISQVRGRPNTLEEILKTVNRKTLPQIKSINPAVHHRLRATLPDLVKAERSIILSGPRRIIFGDFHPLNILNHHGRAVVVDLDDLAAGSPWRDVGSMLEQIFSILHHQEPKATLVQIKRYQEIFLRNYGSLETAYLPPVIFYQAWIAWRNALFFASKFKPNFTMAKLSLDRCRNFLRLYGS